MTSSNNRRCLWLFVAVFTFCHVYMQSSARAEDHLWMAQSGSIQQHHLVLVLVQKRQSVAACKAHRLHATTCAEASLAKPWPPTWQAVAAHGLSPHELVSQVLSVRGNHLGWCWGCWGRRASRFAPSVRHVHAAQKRRLSWVRQRWNSS
jgi:hypothetical protein